MHRLIKAVRETHNGPLFEGLQSMKKDLLHSSQCLTMTQSVITLQHHLQLHIRKAMEAFFIRSHHVSVHLDSLRTFIVISGKFFSAKGTGP